MDFDRRSLTYIDVGLTLHIAKHGGSAMHQTPTTLPRTQGSVMSV